MSKVICAFSIIVMLVGLGFAIQRMSYLREATLTQATITKIIESTSPSGALKYAAVYVFSDKVGNNVKIVSSRSNRPPIVKVGDSIEILYLPANPKNTIRNQFYSKWGFALATGAMGFLYFLIFAVIAHVTDKRIQHQAQAADANAT